jgi:hypothetical protein
VGVLVPPDGFTNCCGSSETCETQQVVNPFAYLSAPTTPVM